MSKHFYILPDGRKSLTMKEGCVLMNIGPKSFRILVRKGIIKKITSKTKWYGGKNYKNQ